MKLWNDFREWWDTRGRNESSRERVPQTWCEEVAVLEQRERDALIAESFARKGRGAQGIQRAMAVRIATAIREGRSA